MSLLLDQFVQDFATGFLFMTCLFLALIGFANSGPDR